MVRLIIYRIIQHHAHCHLYDFAVKNDEFDVSAWFIEKFLAVDGKHTQAGKIRIVD